MTEFSASATSYEGAPNQEMKMIVHVITGSVSTSSTLDCASTSIAINKRIKTVRYAMAHLTADGTAVPLTWATSIVTCGTIGSAGNVALVVWGTD